MSDNLDLNRRAFLKASGLTAAGLAVGVSASTAAEDGDAFTPEFANWRVREARKVWDLGYTGRQDRPLGLTDSGVDALHPDLGPWNGVRVESVGDTFQLVEDTYEPLPDANYDTTLTLGAGLAGSATVSTDPIEVPGAADRLRLGAFDAGLEENVVVRVLDSEGEELASNDGLLGDYIGLATPVARSQTTTVTVEIEATDSTGADVDLRVRFFENTAGSDGGAATLTTFEPVGSQTIEGSIGPTVTGAPNSTQRHPVGADAEGADRVQATLTWSPQPQDLDFALVDGDGNEVASSGNAPGESEAFTVGIDPSRTDYEFVVTGYAAVQADYTIDATYEEQVQAEGAASGPNTAQKVVDGIDAVTDPDDKTLAWYGTPRYGQFAKPRDGNGHGTHCSSIMGGSGRASTVDTDTVQVEEPQALLAPEQVVEYTVDAQAGTGVFASAYGTALSVRIEGPEGETLAHSHMLGGGPHNYDASLLDSNIATAPTVHDEGTETYTVYVSPSREGETGASLAAQLERIAVGAYVDPGATRGEADSEAVDTVNAGVAPDAGIVGVQGLGDGLAAFARDPAFWTREFGVRTVNMSWGTVGGAPFGGLGGVLDGGPAQVKQMAEGGLLTVAAAGNSFTPANGNSAPAVADEAISVVATGPLDGISAFSSGGTQAVDEDDGGTYGKPDVTAPGGRAPLYPASVAVPIYDDILAAEAGIPEEGGERRAYTGKGGTSMASPFTNGVAGLVAQAMEEDAPGSICLPDPGETAFDDVMRLKQVLLATASETVFTAAPYHTAKSVPHAPTYDFGDRDPYEGFGRVNPDTAVQAVTRELGGTTSGTVGLNLPEDSRAIAGYVQGTGTFTVDLSFSHLSGGNQGMAKGSPHLDLFVYDAETPAANGEPNVVARSQALQGSTSLSFDGDGTYYVVAKLVNVPGVVNGYDVQAHVDLSVSFDEALPVESASRGDNSSVFTGGQTSHQTVELTASESLYVRDTVPAGWSVQGGDFDHAQTEGDVTKVVFTPLDGDGTTDLDADYFAEAPSGVENSGQSTFGPIEVSLDGETWVAVSGTTDTNTVVGQST
jgi:hypothetical protein